MPSSLLKQLDSFINLQLSQIFHDHICCNISYDGKGDGKDKVRTNEAKGVATTQEQRPP
jgi:hypothetical protein